MKQYPSIGRDIVDQPIIAFAKYDGSNIRCEWTRKTGFEKFGSRRVLLGSDHPFLGKAIDLFKDTYSVQLGDAFKQARFEKVTCFFEFFGPKSFAGLHQPDDDHQVVLFDLDVFKKGLMLPRDFVRLTAGMKAAEVLYEGKPNEPFLKSVRDSTLPGMPLEGVVCKGAPLKNGYPPNMFKIKSTQWIDKVKAMYADWEVRL